ncbi:hypothetical protein [Dokdonella sp.]|uniref:hypothetical protein n=1 Tax=Dokdonella sp. TaxID=2291710 RepID=UPI001B147FA1|nr:hypothetical protein [Dokdonella sp.]MBO9663444.1 hypothetical protein [Dokdonella sp.]
MSSLALSLARVLALGAALFAASAVPAHAAAGHPGVVKPPASLAVTKPLGAAPAGVTDLKFRELFKLPVGPQGLEPTEKLAGLDGKRVRIVGYMVQQEPPIAGGFMLSPLPVAAGDADDSYADDIPASAIFVTLPKGADTIVPPLAGLIQLTGTLHVGARDMAGAGRVAPAVLELDRAPERSLLRQAKTIATSSAKAR